MSDEFKPLIVEGEELKVNIPKSEVDKIIKEYKRIKKSQ